jgi:uncharacterized protein YheU (UPF0270 family)
VIEIPPERLPEGTLVADYGNQEVSLDNKISQVRRQLNGGDIVITFDPVTENCTLLTRRQVNRYQQENLAANEDNS